MLLQFYKLEKDAALSHRNYSLVLSEPDSPLSSYVNDHITDYFTEILKHCGGKITDDESVSYEVLNNKDIPLNLKQNYASMLKVGLSSLEGINDAKLWVSLLKSDSALLYSEENVIAYCSHAGWAFDSALVAWVNRQESPLDFSKKALYRIESEAQDKFLDAVVLCDSLSEERYKEFTSSIGIGYNEFKLDSIKDDKMMILIKNDLIFINSENLVFVRDNYSFSILCHFITRDIDEYVSMLEQDSSLLDEKELDYVISTKSGVPENKQIEILKLHNGNLSIKNKPYSEGVVFYILTNLFLENDYQFLVNNYDGFSIGIKNAITGLLIDRIVSTTESKLSISKELFDNAVSKNQLNSEQVKYLLALALPSIGERDSASYLNTHGLKQFADIIDKGKKPHFDNTDLNIYILDCFVRWGRIKEYNERDDRKIHIKR